MLTGPEVQLLRWSAAIFTDLPEICHVSAYFVCLADGALASDVPSSPVDLKVILSGKFLEPGQVLDGMYLTLTCWVQSSVRAACNEIGLKRYMFAVCMPGLHHMVIFTIP